MRFLDVILKICQRPSVDTQLVFRHESLIMMLWVLLFIGGQATITCDFAIEVIFNILSVKSMDLSSVSPGVQH